jgi:hypothetical protein
MKRCRIKIVSFANGKPCNEAGSYIKNFDAEAYPARGSVLLTWSPDEARLFRDQQQAYEFWQTQSKHEPIRPDGRPNRPLTAYNVTVETF